VLIGSVQPLPYSPNRYTINITVLTLESPSSSLLALAQGSCDYSRRRETPIGGEVQLVGIALITINQRDRHILVPQATITNKCHSLYVVLVSLVVVVIQIYSSTKLTWMDGWIFLRCRSTYFSLAAPSADRQSHQSENHHDSTNERSLKLRHRGCSVLSTRKSKVRAFSSCAIRSNGHTAMITAAMVVMMSTEQPNARASTPSSQRCKAAAEIKIQAQRAAIAVVLIVMIDAWYASSHRSERVDQHQRSLGATATMKRVYWRVWHLTNKSPIHSNRLT